LVKNRNNVKIINIILWPVSFDVLFVKIEIVVSILAAISDSISDSIFDDDFGSILDFWPLQLRWWLQEKKPDGRQIGLIGQFY
jgi:hypothetical protein